MPLIADQPGQLPRKMHTPVSDLPSISVGATGATIIGKDNRVLQAAVDYIGNLGGGTVRIGAGEYLMHDSLHLRSNVRVVGVSGSTILKKAKGSRSLLLIDGDSAGEQIPLKDPTGFDIGYGVTVDDDIAGGFHSVVARITGKRGDTFSIDKPLNADCMINNGAYAPTFFRVISGYDLDGAELKNLTIDGNKENNGYLNGCRGGGIFFYRGFGTIIDGCHVKNYRGDGISFQQSNDVTVKNCISDGNTHLGLFIPAVAHSAQS